MIDTHPAPLLCLSTPHTQLRCYDRRLPIKGKPAAEEEQATIDQHPLTFRALPQPPYTATGGPPVKGKPAAEEKQATIDERDPMWVELRHLFVAEVYAAIGTRFKEFLSKNKAAKAASERGGGWEGGRERARVSVKWVGRSVG